MSKWRSMPCYGCGEMLTTRSRAKYILCKRCREGMPDSQSGGSHRGECPECGGLRTSDDAKFCDECLHFVHSPNLTTTHHNNPWEGEDDGKDWPTWPPQEKEDDKEKPKKWIGGVKKGSTVYAVNEDGGVLKIDNVILPSEV